MRFVFVFLSLCLSVANAQEPQLSGNYRVREDLANPANKNPPKTIDLYWDTEHECPVVRITDADQTEQKLILATFDDTRRGGTHTASIKKSTDSVFRWGSTFNQASSIDNYLESVTTIELTKREGRMEITLTTASTSTRFVDDKPQVDSAKKTRRFLLELEK